VLQIFLLTYLIVNFRKMLLIMIGVLVSESVKTEQCPFAEECGGGQRMVVARPLGCGQRSELSSVL